jgi:membrane peptidoglycan carboxypeptidase
MPLWAACGAWLKGGGAWLKGGGAWLKGGGAWLKGGGAWLKGGGAWLWRGWSRRRRHVLRVMIIALAATLLTSVGAVAAYADSVPLPNEPQVPQASVLYYRDGSTVLARLGVANRTDVPISAIPVGVRQAVLAAEDRAFYDHFGLSVRGVARAAWTDLFGGGQGASTITQQYARNAYLTQKRTASRKAQEMVLAIKIERKYDKDEILDRYLNTIYYGRGAYGIQAAARAYFGTTSNQLTVAQGAVLASAIKDPWRYDPEEDARSSRNRWQWVINSMVSQKWLDAHTAATLAYPDVISHSTAAASLGGPDGLIVDAVERELAARGVSPQALRTGGLRVVTTVDQTAQQAAVEQMTNVSAISKDLHSALVAVDPATGGIRAYYGGRQGQGFYDDAAAVRAPASTFKPIVLAAGLANGVSYLSRWDGSTPRAFPGRLGVPLSNQKGLSCPDCTLDESMVQSLNTPFYALAEKLGAPKIRQLAVSLGISETYNGTRSMVDVKGDPRPGKTRADISIGRYPVSPADLASVYATFASGGTRTDRHFVESATGADGATWYAAAPAAQRVIDPKVAADVTTVLHHVAEHDGQPAGHDAAAKTGTQAWGNTSDNQDAWMAGYTPELSTVVWVGRATPGPIRDATGAPIAGDGLPATLWRDFMSHALGSTPAAALPAPAHLGRTDAGDAGKVKHDSDQAGTASGLRLVDRTRSGGKTLALTFDDGPSTYTGAVLDVLAQYHVKATFCMVGEQVVDNRSVVRRMVAEGHELCDHSMHHDDLSTMTTDKIKDDLLGTINEIRGVSADARVNYFRAPYGNWGASAKIGVGLGMTPVTWTVDTGDWETPGVDAIVQAVHEQLKQGGIVLMHDGGGSREQTVAALKIVIPQLLSAGWTFDLPATSAAPVVLPPLPTSPSATAPASGSPQPSTSGSASPSGSASASPSASGSAEPSGSVGPSEDGSPSASAPAGAGKTR